MPVCGLLPELPALVLHLAAWQAPAGYVTESLCDVVGLLAHHASIYLCFLMPTTIILSVQYVRWTWISDEKCSSLLPIADYYWLGNLSSSVLPGAPI